MLMMMLIIIDDDVDDDGDVVVVVDDDDDDDGDEDNAEDGARLHSRNACPHDTRDIRRATLRGNLQEQCRGPDWAQNADEHFVRACAVEMHVHMSQDTSEEPL